VVIERRAARVLLLADGSVLLIKGIDPAQPDAGPWWLVPGGGVDDGESVEAAAVREVLEETGLGLDPRELGPVVATRVAEFEFERRRFRQTEWLLRWKCPPSHRGVMGGMTWNAGPCWTRDGGASTSCAEPTRPSTRQRSSS
jgi:8-oxo-dGTP pyrophosphatase MutT (NUDIX family)